MKPAILRAFAWYASRVAQTVQYTSWSNEFCREENAKSTTVFLNELKQYIDWSNITLEDACALGFTLWDDNLYLLPLYILPIVPIGTKLTSISGEEVTYDGKNIDKDTRFGCVAYGIEIKE